MKRLAVVMAGLAAGSVFGADAPREWIELKQYTCSSVEVRDKLIGVFDSALIPALNRQGAKKVGVLWTDTATNDNKPDYNTAVFVLASFPTAEACLKAEWNLLSDAAFMRDAAALFNAPMKEPLYDKCESMVFHAFAMCPTLEQPTTSPDRLLQLRYYNSYTPERNAKKIHMFEGGGELALFRKCGMPPVFFGEAVAGAMLPNLTYIVAFENKAAKDAGWKTFIESPEWQVMKADPQYKDTANKIVNVVLKPSPKSQL